MRTYNTKQENLYHWVSLAALSDNEDGKESLKSVYASDFDRGIGYAACDGIRLHYAPESTAAAGRYNPGTAVQLASDNVSDDTLLSYTNVMGAYMNHLHKITVNAEDFTRMIIRAMVFNQEVVFLQVKDRVLYITARTDELGEITSKLDTDYAEAWGIYAVNPSYLLDAVSGWVRVVNKKQADVTTRYDAVPKYNQVSITLQAGNPESPAGPLYITSNTGPAGMLAIIMRQAYPMDDTESSRAIYVKPDNPRQQAQPIQDTAKTYRQDNRIITRVVSGQPPVGYPYRKRLLYGSNNPAPAGDNFCAQVIASIPNHILSIETNSQAGPAGIEYHMIITQASESSMYPERLHYIPERREGMVSERAQRYVRDVLGFDTLGYGLTHFYTSDPRWIDLDSIKQQAEQVAQSIRAEQAAKEPVPDCPTCDVCNVQIIPMNDIYNRNKLGSIYPDAVMGSSYRPGLKYGYLCDVHSSMQEYSSHTEKAIATAKGIAARNN